MEQLWRDALAQFGFTSVYILLALPLIKWLGGTAIAKWIDTRLDASLQKRVATAQFELDQQMVRIQSAIDRDADQIRSVLSREHTDFALWAERRHDATARLFAAFLQAETAVTNLSQFTFIPTDGQPEEYVVSVIKQVPSLAARTDEIVRLHREGAHQRVDDMLEHALTDQRRAHIISARNAAYEAYYQSALYLSDEVDAAACEVRDHFHTILVPYVATARDPLEHYKNKTDLRFLMRALLNRARADLGRASRPPAFVTAAPEVAEIRGDAKRD